MTASGADGSAGPGVDEETRRDRIRLCVVVATMSSVRYLYTQRAAHFRDYGIDVSFVCAPAEREGDAGEEGVPLFHVPMTRSIAPLTDVRAIWRLRRYLRRGRFDIVEASTPKGALIGVIAARLAGARCVVHVLRGLAYEGKRGLVGWLLRMSTALPCRLAHHTISISPSLRDQAVRDGMCRPDRIRVLGHGSYKGVDLTRFHPDRRRAAPKLRRQYGIPPEAIVFGFLGRMTRDKGMIELACAFERLRRERDDVVLLVVGDYEQRDRPPADIVRFLETNPGVCHLGWHEDVVPLYAALDVLVLPTHREGFGNVLAEAGATGIPAVTTRATGARDATARDLTAFQVPVGDSSALYTAMKRLAEEPELRAKMGAAGRAWVAERFDRRRVWPLYSNEYRRLLGYPPLSDRC